jgi:hypothetical protein
VVNGVPECIAVSAWLGQWRIGAISTTDAANAVESITGQLHCDGKPWRDVLTGLTRDWPIAPALPEPGDPCGVPYPDALSAIALSADLLLVRRADGWHTHRASHTVPTRSLADAQRDLTEMAQRAQREFEQLDTVGSRSQADAALATLRIPALPPSLSQRSRRALHMAARIMALVEIALVDSDVPSSRSQDSKRIDLLLDVKRSARGLLMASVTQ